MKLGDKVRDKTRGFIGTIIGMEGTPTQRVLIQCEPAPGARADAPHVKVWQMVGQTELIDLSGKPVQGKAAASVDAGGQRVSASGSNVDEQGHVIGGQLAGTATNYDSAGKQISATH